MIIPLLRGASILLNAHTRREVGGGGISNASLTLTLASDETDGVRNDMKTDPRGKDRVGTDVRDARVVRGFDAVAGCTAPSSSAIGLIGISSMTVAVPRVAA